MGIHQLRDKCLALWKHKYIKIGHEARFFTSGTGKVSLYTGYVEDGQQNGESIIEEAPTLKELHEKIMMHLPTRS